MRGNGQAPQPILIAGGGIGGLGAALALARKGRPVHVLEQAPEFREVGAGIQLGPNVFGMFERLGLTEAVNEIAVFPDNLIMMDSITGEEVTRVALGADVRARFGHPYAVIHRADLHEVILNACRGLNLITLENNRKVAHFEETGPGVRVVTEDGSTYDGAGLIGCDGLWSTVRNEIVGDGAPRVSGHIAYRAVVPMNEVPKHLARNDVVLWAGPKTHLVHYPLRRGELFNIVAVFHSDRYVEGWNTNGDPEELHMRFRETREEVRTLLGMIESWRMWVLCDREPIKGWTRGRATLLGDAAHPMLQYLAQGAAMAMEDAVCLADMLGDAGDDVEAAFGAYEGARYLRTGRVQLTARFYGDLYHAAGVTRELRNLMLAGRSPSAGHEGMAWLYGGP